MIDQKIPANWNTKRSEEGARHEGEPKEAPQTFGTRHEGEPKKEIITKGARYEGEPKEDNE